MMTGSTILKTMDLAPRDGTRILTFYSLSGKLTPLVIRWDGDYKAMVELEMLVAPKNWILDTGLVFHNPNCWMHMPDFTKGVYPCEVVKCP